MKKIVFSALSLAVAVSLNATVFATVNGKNITESELAPLLAGSGLNPAALNAEQKKQVIDRAIEFQLLVEQAQKSGVTNDKAYKQQLELAKNELAVRAWQGKRISETKVSDSEVKDFYNKNKAKFIEPAAVRAKHIVVKTESDAKTIISELKGLSGNELSVKFSELAVAKSIEPAAKQSGGNLGWFAKEQMVPAFANAAFAMKKGELSKTPVKTEFGYHVILKEDQRDKRQASVDEVKSFIENVLKQEKAAKSLDGVVKDLRKKAKIEYK